MRKVMDTDLLRVRSGQSNPGAENFIPVVEMLSKKHSLYTPPSVTATIISAVFIGGKLENDTVYSLSKESR